VAFGFDLEHGPASFFLMERDPFDQSRKALWQCCFGCVLHRLGLRLARKIKRDKLFAIL
jgi:hypothetical protein